MTTPAPHDAPAQPVHLIHVGFPKCASKYLQRWFGAHPEIAYCWNGFGGERGVEDFLHPFVHPDPRIRCRVTSHEALVDPRDVTTLGRLDYEEIARRRDRQVAVAHELGRRYPDARILMVTRNHADVLRSGYSEMVRQGGAMTDADLARAGHGEFAASGHYDYDFAIALYRTLFGDRLLVLPAEWLTDDPAAFTAAVASFAGIGTGAPLSGPANASLTAEALYWYPRFAKVIARTRPGRLRPRLAALHMAAIRHGAWRPLLALLRLVAGRRTTQIIVPPDLLEEMASTCQTLVTLPHVAPYRDRYITPPAG